MVSGTLHTGRAWVFREANINTDLLMPAAGFHLPLNEQAALVLERVRPGWSAAVETGDILVGGRNFGTGSGRPAARLLVHLGIAAVLAESTSDLFYRNSINLGLAVVEVPGVIDAVSEGDMITVDVLAGRVTNRDTGAELSGAPMPDLLQEILSAGGLLARLKKEGYVA